MADKKPKKIVTTFTINPIKSLTKDLIKEVTGKIEVPKNKNKN